MAQVLSATCVPAPSCTAAVVEEWPRRVSQHSEPGSRHAWSPAWPRARAGTTRPKQTAANSGYVRPYASTLGDAFHQLVEVPVDQRDRVSKAQEGEDRRQFAEWFSRIEQN